MKILILGAYGQVGLELVRALSAKIPLNNIYCADIKEPPSNSNIVNHINLNALDKQGLYDAIKKYNISQLYCLSALLSATGEVNPLKTD